MPLSDWAVVDPPLSVFFVGKDKNKKGKKKGKKWKPRMSVGVE